LLGACYGPFYGAFWGIVNVRLCWRNRSGWRNLLYSFHS
jgi:hypothetical protein